MRTYIICLFSCIANHNFLFYCREQESNYTFTVTAEDTEGLTSNTTVVVTLEDVNDETPVFTNDE